MGKQNSKSATSWLNSVESKFSAIVNKLYLDYRGKEYKEKLEKSEKAFKDLFMILSENPEATEHLKEISDLLDSIIKENRRLSIKEVFYTILRIIGYAMS